MSLYKYKALTNDKKTVSGIVEAPSEGIAIDILKEKSLVIISLTETKGKGKFSIVLDRVKPKDVVIFSRQFSVLISSNITLVQALRLLIDQTNNEKFKMVLSEITDDVDGGSNLSSAMAKHGKVFSSFYINVVKSGETSGKLDEVLEYLADEMEKDYDMTSKIKGAMMYPAFIFSALLIVGGVMMKFVVPKLTAVITETGMELPLPTKILIFISDFVSAFWWLLILFIIGLVFGIKITLKSQIGKKVFDTLILKIPIFGKLFQRIYLVRFVRSLQTLLLGGINISKALGITSKIISNEVYKELIIKTKKNVEDGNSMSLAFIGHKNIPKMVPQMISIGEKTGRLDVMLGNIARFFTREINNTVANLMTLMEPIIMVTLGIAVGIMVAAIIMPMYNMSSAV